MIKIAIVAFTGTVAHKVMDACEGYDSFLVGSSRLLIKKFVDSGVLDDYDKIVAMGLLPEVKATYVHVEPCCTTKVDGHVPLDTSFVDDNMFKLVLRPMPVDTFCNILALGLKQRYPHKTIAFLHMPPGVNVNATGQAITSKLASF